MAAPSRQPIHSGLFIKPDATANVIGAGPALLVRLKSMKPPNRQPASSASRLVVAVAAAVDAFLILVFAAVGRDAHQRGDAVTGVLLTAWPFLAGAALGWLAARAWRQPLSPRRAGLPVWLAAVGAGMLLRLLTGQAVVLPFIIVALLGLGLLIAGWRLAWAGIMRLRAIRQGRAESRST